MHCKGFRQFGVIRQAILDRHDLGFVLAYLRVNACQELEEWLTRLGAILRILHLLFREIAESDDDIPNTNVALGVDLRDLQRELADRLRRIAAPSPVSEELASEIFVLPFRHQGTLNSRAICRDVPAARRTVVALETSATCLAETRLKTTAPPQREN